MPSCLANFNMYIFCLCVCTRTHICAGVETRGRCQVSCSFLLISVNQGHAGPGSCFYSVSFFLLHLFSVCAHVLQCACGSQKTTMGVSSFLHLALSTFTH